jgi:hypothetical protein
MVAEGEKDTPALKKFQDLVLAFLFLTALGCIVARRDTRGSGGLFVPPVLFG